MATCLLAVHEISGSNPTVCILCVCHKKKQLWHIHRWAVSRPTQPSTLIGMIKWISALGMAIVGVEDSSLQADLDSKSVGLSVLHSSDKSSELSQWRCYDHGIIHIVLSIIIPSDVFDQGVIFCCCAFCHSACNLAWKIHTGVKNPKFCLDIRPQSPLSRLNFKTKQHIRNIVSRLWGATPSTWNFGSTGPRWSEIADFEPIFARSASAVTPSEKRSITLIGIHYALFS